MQSDVGRLEWITSVFIFETVVAQPLIDSEYKRARKVRSDYLCAGIGSITVRDEVVQRATIPIEYGEKLKYPADQVVAVVGHKHFNT